MDYQGDHAWILTSSALVLFMTPGLAFFYGGMVRSKNMLGMLMQNFFSMGLISVIWGVVGFSLAFGNFGDGGLLGDFEFAWMRDLFDPSSGARPALDMIYQATFAIITPALITGAIADRMRFSAWVWFLGLWSILVYSPVAHWVFGGGWMAKMGALDFAGGAVVHINAGAAALAAVIILGKRKGWPKTAMPPHMLPWTLLGAGILWFGWFGFNAGSAGLANGQAVQAFVNTNMAAAAAMLGWLAVERLKDGHATTLGAASGAVAGLVAITPCAGFVSGMSPFYIGAAAGVICYLAIQLKFKLQYDDSLDVVGVHLVGGLVGSLLLGFFADDVVNALGQYAAVDGVFTGGGWGLFKDQAVASFATFGYSFAMSAIILLGLKAVLPKGIRVTEDEEDQGLDLTQHAEVSYALGDMGSMARE
ncbi:MAG TPA: ammonium transporter [Acidimicrobiia bacterium]|nr:ammonium transporter [Acidimicrobiia bacterium]